MTFIQPNGWRALIRLFFYGCFMVFPKIGVPQNEWLRMENLIKMDDLVSFPIIFGNTIFFSNDKDTFF